MCQLTTGLLLVLVSGVLDFGKAAHLYSKQLMFIKKKKKRNAKITSQQKQTTGGETCATCLAAVVFHCVYILSGSLLQTSLTKGSICVFKGENPFCNKLTAKCETNTITYIKPNLTSV